MNRPPVTPADQRQAAPCGALTGIHGSTSDRKEAVHRSSDAAGDHRGVGVTVGSDPVGGVPRVVLVRRTLLAPRTGRPTLAVDPGALDDVVEGGRGAAGRWLVLSPDEPVLGLLAEHHGRVLVVRAQPLRHRLAALAEGGPVDVVAATDTAIARMRARIAGRTLRLHTEHDHRLAIAARRWAAASRA